MPTRCLRQLPARQDWPDPDVLSPITRWPARRRPAHPDPSGCHSQSQPAGRVRQVRLVAIPQGHPSVVGRILPSHASSAVRAAHELTPDGVPSSDTYAIDASPITRPHCLTTSPKVARDRRRRTGQGGEQSETSMTPSDSISPSRGRFRETHRTSKVGARLAGMPFQRRRPLAAVTHDDLHLRRPGMVSAARSTASAP